MRFVVGACVAWQVLVSTPGDGDPFALFRPTAIVSATERQQLDQGVPLVRILAADGQELAALAAVAIAPDQSVGRAAAWIRQVDDLRANRYVLAAGRFSMPPRIEDLDGLTLDEEDLQDIRGCRPRQCGVKLSEAEIEELHTVRCRRARRVLGRPRTSDHRSAGAQGWPEGPQGGRPSHQHERRAFGPADPIPATVTCRPRSAAITHHFTAHGRLRQKVRMGGEFFSASSPGAIQFRSPMPWQVPCSMQRRGHP